MAVEIQFEYLLLALIISYLSQMIVIWEGSKNALFVALALLSFGVGSVVFYLSIIFLPQVI